MRRLAATLVAGVVAAAVSLTPAVATEDDPTPAKYPQVKRPDSGSNTSDPRPAKYPGIEKPGVTGGNDDPKPVSWPAPKAG